IEFKPEAQVTIEDVRSGAFRKCTIANSAEVIKIDMFLRPLLRKIPSTKPRKKVSSMSGTVTEAPAILTKPSQLMAERSEKTCRRIKAAPQQSRGIAARKNPAKRSRDQCSFRSSDRSRRLRTWIERNKGQSKTSNAT